MKDYKLTKKKDPSRSLAARLLFVALLVWVLPLFVQTAFLYRKEYGEEIEKVQQELTLLAREKGELLYEMILLDWQLLEAAALLEDREKQAAIVQEIFLSKEVKDSFVLVSQSQQEILVGKAVSSKRALTVSIPLRLLEKRASFLFPVRLAVFLDGKLVWQDVEPKKESLTALFELPIAGLALSYSVEEKEVLFLHRSRYYARFAMLLFFVGGLGSFLVALFAKKLSFPLKELERTFARIKEGSPHARYRPHWLGFEINAIGLELNSALDSLFHHMQEAEKERLEKQKLQSEWKIGRQMQKSLLPQHLLEIEGLDIGALYRPAEEVNGDFYDLFSLPDGRLLWIVADTAGKGISACIFSLGLRSMIRALARKTSHLETLVDQVNDLYFLDAHSVSMFTTAWLGIYDPKTKELVYCSQGHPPAVLLRGGSAQELTTQGIALGAQQLEAVTIRKIVLQKGDLVALYTDGVSEAHNRSGNLFGKDRLIDLLKEKKEGTMQGLAERIEKELFQFSQGILQHDDITLLLFMIEV